MIPCKQKTKHTLHWKKVFADSYVGIKELSKTSLDLSINQELLNEVDTLFSIQITKQLLETHDLDSAVLHQYLPNTLELIDPPGYSSDPVGDIAATQQPGVIKKYNHRALLITNNTCPIHCRYCFRKDFPYPTSKPSIEHFNDALRFFSLDKTINEVILSGGDPLSLEDDMLAHLFNSIEKIPHIKTIRLHTKFPSIIPERITPRLIEIMTNCKLNKVCIFHINHPDEINRQFCDVVQKIKNTNTVTLNQSVLLNNVNNNTDTLVNLSHKLFDAGILPYYLHRLDPAKGTHHFHVTIEETRKIMQDLKDHLPGYLVPKLAQEIPGHSSKSY